MSIRKYNYIFLTMLFSTISLPINAGQLYRYLDKDGVITVSKSLPPYAAQNGYDILNGTSLFLIKTIPPALTPEQIVAQERQQAEQQEVERLAEITAEEERKRQKQQAIYDQNLLASYQSEQELLKARATDISYRQTQLTKASEQLVKNKQKLHDLQQQAAEQELSGHTISANLKKRLDTTQATINHNQTEIERLQIEELQLRTRYKEELIRLKQLLSKR